MILSQLIRGAAEELISRPGELVDPVLVGAAMARAADARLRLGARARRGHDAHRHARDGAPRRQRDRAPGRRRGCSSDVPQEQQNALIADVLERAIDRRRGARQARPRAAAGPARGRRRRRRRLRRHDHLRRRGRRAARRRAAAELEHHAPGAGHPSRARAPRPTATARTSRSPASGLDADGLASGRWRRSATRVLVVGDAHTLKVHVHTDEPERATRAVRRRRRGLAPRRRRHARAGRASAARGSAPSPASAAARSPWSPATGMRALFESVGAFALDGGPTLNPSTYELLAGIHERAPPRRSSCCPTPRTW